ncbi:hypothetical protein L2E82_30633 [Cichorium intybus]|uniref:Uncharacterized protein n=1 Tax=Cichorium intybus TaxID=13427 RepID=A0ACB9D0X2_CICIN|nr:hypothetical protein L2E82_30633 [Cichorium intybus]
MKVLTGAFCIWRTGAHVINLRSELEDLEGGSEIEVHPSSRHLCGPKCCYQPGLSISPCSVDFVSSTPPPPFASYSKTVVISRLLHR